MIYSIHNKYNKVDAMQYKYKKPKEKTEKKPKTQMKVVVEKVGEESTDGQGEVKVTLADVSANSKKSKRSIITSIILLFVVALFCGTILYFGNYYHTTEYPERLPENVDFRALDDGSFAFVPDNPIAGFVFYPGAKVEYTAYENLMVECADNGILCILVKMPLNFPLIKTDAADEYIKQFPSIKNWYVGGHSLGGLSAAYYAEENSDSLKGLILLAAYSTKDISDTHLSVLTVYGTNDEVLNMKNYNEYGRNLPYDSRECVIEGGCHSYFGSYGIQKGDGTPEIEADEQIDKTVSAILKLVISDIE